MDLEDIGVVVLCIMGSLVALGIAALIIFGIFVSSFGSASGEHTGIVTASENTGIIWHTDSAYFKTNAQSSQEDKYCVTGPSFYAQIQAAQSSQKEMTITYSNPLIVWAWQCIMMTNQS